MRIETSRPLSSTLSSFSVLDLLPYSFERLAREPPPPPNTKCQRYHHHLNDPRRASMLYLVRLITASPLARSSYIRLRER